MMLRVLIPIDGSENSLRAAGFLIKQIPLYRESLEIHLLNVQRPFPGTITLAALDTKKFHHDEAIKALANARELLDRAGIAYAHHIVIGEYAETIAQFVKDKKIDLVVMGTCGASAVANLLLGSVTTKVLHMVNVPVLLVK
jgi:nucleotide-binding universal stress UspA family protein